MAFTEYLQNRGVVLFRRDVRSGWLRAEIGEREADVIVVRAILVARQNHHQMSLCATSLVAIIRPKIIVRSIGSGRS